MRVFNNFDLGKISWLKVGGVAKKFVILESIDELLGFDEVYFYAIGACSNLLSSGFIDRPVVKLSGEFESIAMDGFKIRAGAGVLSKVLANFALKNELAGLEQFFTIPGSVGGMVKMNAGCYGIEVKDVLDSITVYNKEKKKIETILRKDINFEYRSSNLPDSLVILFAVFNCSNGKHDEIKSRMDSFESKRQETQIKSRTCGSTFKNPVGAKAWEMIDAVGLRGYHVGGARFSEKHCNFIETTDSATVSDIEKLISLAKSKVQEKFGILLEEEVKFLK